MTNTTTTERFAGNVRAHLAREGSSIAKLAQEMGVGSVWLSRRIGARRTVDITVEEAYVVATAIGVPLNDLLSVASEQVAAS